MGILLNGNYYPDGVERPQEAHPVVGTQTTAYGRAIAAQRFDMELIQPYLSDGRPNPDFIKYYPKEAKEYGMV